MRQRRGDEIEPGAVAADDDEIRHPHMRREQRHLGLAARRHLIGQRINAQKTVGLGKGGDGAGAFACRVRDQSARPFDQRHHDEFGAAEFGGDPHRHPCIDLGVRTRWQARHPPQHRHDHVVEGEHRRGREPRQNHHRIAVADGKAQRLARLERDAVRDDARVAQPADDPMRQIAGALRGAAGQHQHLAGRERITHRSFELVFVVGNGAEKHRFAAIFVHRRCDDRTIGVIDCGRRQRLTGLHQFVAGRDHRNARPAGDGDVRDAAGRQHADLARADDGAGAQQRLAAGDIGTGIGHELPWGSGAADFDRRMSRRLRVLNHDDSIRPARHWTAGRD